jgi:hypothetical protein
MDNLSSQEIKRLWAEHFPKRRDNEKSRTLLAELALTVLERAHEGETYYTLLALGIPKREFDQFRSEQLAEV